MDVGDVQNVIFRVVDSGHMVGGSTLIGPETGSGNLIAQLQEAGFPVSGEFQLEVSETGKNFRSTVKFAPKESIFSKILARFSVTFDPTKLVR